MSNLARSALAGAGARTASMLASLVGVSAVYRTAGFEEFSIYAIATTLTLVLPLADLGLGLGLVTLVAQSKGAHDENRVLRLASTGAVALLAAAVFVSVVVTLGWFYFPWVSIFGLGTESGARNAGCTVLLALAWGLPAGIGNKLLFATSRAHIAYVFDTASGVIMLLGNVLAWQFRLPVLAFLAIAFWVPVAVNGLESAWLFLVGSPELRPNGEYLSLSELRTMLGMGIALSFSGMAITISLQSDLLVLSHISSSSNVAQYALAMRLATVFMSFASVMLTPAWPAFATRHARRETGEAKQLLGRLRVSVLALSFGFIVLIVVFGPAVLHLWAGSSATTSRVLLLATGVAVVVQVAHLPSAMALNGMGRRAFQVSTTCAMAVLNLLLSVLLTRLLGAPGPAWGTAIAYFLAMLAPGYLYLRRAFASGVNPLGVAHAS